MDPIICSYPHQSLSEDLNICPYHGIAYQKSMEVSVEYGKDYFEKYISYEGANIAKKINEFRTTFSNPHCRCLLDIGIGSGEFIKNSAVKVLGYDVNPYAIAWLNKQGLFCDPYQKIPQEIQGMTLWDTLEHIEKPSLLLKKVRAGMHVFISIPIFSSIHHIKESKHYRPNEHYYYFTESGLIKYFQDLDYHLVEVSSAETMAGREDIGSFHFLKY